MDEIAGWIAPAATMTAAMMTASNLGSRVTGWGFVVFGAGSIAWLVVGSATGQTNLLLTNAFLTLVNIFGVWRWLGRRAAYDEGARAAAKASHASAAPSVFQLGTIEGWIVRDAAGETVGQVVDAMAESESGRISYFVIRQGGMTTVPDRLHAVAWNQLKIMDQEIQLDLTGTQFAALPEITRDAWPVRAGTAPA